MYVYRVAGKVIPSIWAIAKLFAENKLSFRVVERRYSGDTVSVLVRGEKRESLLRRWIDEEWVVLDVSLLADLFCVEKYARVCDRRSFEWRREYIRAKLVATRYAVGLAKKRIEMRYAGKDFSDFTEEDAQRCELTSIYLRTDELRREVKEKLRNLEHIRKLKSEYPRIYKEVLSKYKTLTGVRFLTHQQRKKIHALVNELNMSDSEYRRILRSKYGVSSSLGLGIAEADNLIRELENFLNAKKEAKIKEKST